jgi:predicted RNase H-like HicB family nuclease
MSNTLRYPAQVYWSDDDKGFIAIASDLPGCSAFGKTQERALAELQDAIAGWIEAAKSVGNPIPEPSPPPEVSAYSGKILVRMTRELHAQLAQAAKNEGVSLNQYINQVLAMGMGRRTAQERRSKQRSTASALVK